jgi:uncharacterized Zn-binding protein involved in type VI secretion
MLCLLPGHNNSVIAEGGGNWLITGKPVALVGRKTSCGAKLMATVGNTNRSKQ